MKAPKVILNGQAMPSRASDAQLKTEGGIAVGQ